MHGAYYVLGTALSLSAAAVYWCLSSAATAAASLPDGVKRPVLLVSLTTHARLRPVLHAFRYPVLYVAVDLDAVDYTDALFTSDAGRWRPLSLRPGDYLGARHGGDVRAKLWAHLRDHGVPTDGLRRALLVTTPRLLGYAFNPVSFHFCYDGDDRLAVVVLEVNNTFGEKHLYVLRQDEATADDDASVIRPGYHAARTFPRRFHVSPFNDRAGSYRLQCRDPLADPTAAPSVDMHLTLLEPDGRAKLTARVRSTRPPVPTRDTARALLTLLRHGSAVFLTVPRILGQAYTLHYVHKLGVYLRPEPLEVSGAIGRQSPGSLDAYFQRLLVGYLRANAGWLPCRRVVLDVLPDGSRVVIPGAHADDEAAEELVVTVLSFACFTAIATAASPLTSLWLDSKSLIDDASPLYRVSDDRLFLRCLYAGFNKALGRRWYSCGARGSFRDPATEDAAWFEGALAGTAEYGDFCGVAFRALDNYVHESPDESVWKYRASLTLALWSGHLGDALFGKIATFCGTSPADAWPRVRRAFERQGLLPLTTTEVTIDDDDDAASDPDLVAAIPRHVSDP